jgi:hypothetical protein
VCHTFQVFIFGDVAMAALRCSHGQAAQFDRTTLASLGMSALIELDAVAGCVGAPGFFLSFEPLVGKGLAGTLSGPRDLLVPSSVAELDAALEALLITLRPYLLHRAGLKLLDFLLRVHSVHVHQPQQLLLTVLPYHGTFIYAKSKIMPRV